MIFLFHFVSIVHHSDKFVDVKPFLHALNKPYLIVVHDSLNVLLNLIC